MIASEITTHYKLIYKKLFHVICVLLIILPINLFSQISWEKVYVPDTLAILDVAVDNNGDIYICCGSNPQNSFFGIYNSIDNGLNWDPFGFQDTIISRIEIYNQCLYLTSEKSIFRSINNGEQWELLTNCATGNLSDILIWNFDTIFACGWEGIIRTFNGGIEWDTAILLEPGEYIRDIHIDNERNILFTKQGYLTNDYGLYVSDDWGNSWDKIFNSSMNAIDVNSTNKLFVTSIYQVYSSTDLGQNWDSVFFGASNLLSIEINQEDEVFVGCNTYTYPVGGVWASYDDGTSWEDESEGLTNRSVNRIYLDPAGFLWAVCQYHSEEGVLFRTDQTTVELEEVLDNKTKMELYPNPIINNSKLTIKTDNSITVKDLVIINLYGEKVRSFSFVPDNNKGNTFNVEINFKQTGIYYICINNNETPMLGKLIVL